MIFIRRFITAFLTLGRILTSDLWRIILQILAWVFSSWRRILRKPPPETDRPKRRRHPDCIPLTHPAVKVPDPLIYSQKYFMGLGLAVTWDNPDIVLRKDGVDVSSSALEADTEYEIVARIWNNSPEAPVVDLPVSFSYLTFGIGTQSVPITDPQKPAFVTLGVKGGPSHPAFAVAKWRTPATPGHYCIQVNLQPVSDANYGNNLGQENAQVGAAQSPAEFTFLLRNSTSKRAMIRLETDTYVLPQPPACGPGARPAFNPQTHARARYPVPPGWRVHIDPPNPLLEPEQEQVVRVIIAPPPGFTGRKAFNVNAFTEWSFLGGVTFYVDVR